MSDSLNPDSAASVLSYLRLHRQCERCGREMKCLGPDVNNPPYGIWVHIHTNDVLCLHEEVEEFEKGSVNE